MLSPAATVARLARALFLGVWVTLGATVGHVAGDGSAPPLVALVPVVVGVAIVSWWVTRRRLGFAMVLALLGVPQVAVHLLSDYVHGHLMVPSAAMLAMHVGSILMTAAGVAYGERLWWSLWEIWSSRWRALELPASLVALEPPVLVVAASGGPGPLRHVVTRRGPPAS